MARFENVTTGVVVSVDDDKDGRFDDDMSWKKMPAKKSAAKAGK